MVEEKRDTVVVEGDRRPSYGWLIALVIVVVLIILFFVFGGMNWFNGGGNGGSGATTNVNIQPTTPQQ